MELRSRSIVFYGRGRHNFAGVLLKLPADNREVRFVVNISGFELKHSGGRKPGRPDLFQGCISPCLQRAFSKQEVALGELAKRPSQAGSCVAIKPREELRRMTPATEEIEYEEGEWGGNDAVASEIVLENELVFLPMGHKWSGASKTWSARGHFSCHQQGLDGGSQLQGMRKEAKFPIAFTLRICSSNCWTCLVN